MDLIKWILEMLFGGFTTCAERKKKNEERRKDINRRHHALRKKLRAAAEKRKKKVEERKRIIDRSYLLEDLLGIEEMSREFGRYPYDMKETKNYRPSKQ